MVSEKTEQGILIIPGWHTAPVCGLMNDPAGFICHNGLWHLFWQWNPFGCEHKHACRGHWSLADLVSWTDPPVAPQSGQW